MMTTKIQKSGLRSPIIGSATVLALAFVQPAQAVECVIGQYQLSYCRVGAEMQGQLLVMQSHDLAKSVARGAGMRAQPGAQSPGVVEVLGYAAARDTETDQIFAAVEAPQPIFSGWSEFGAVYSDRVSATEGFSGTLGQGSIGFDISNPDGAVFGVFGGVTSSHHTTTSGAGNGTVDARSATLGAYAGQAFSDNLFGTAVVQYGRTHNSFAVGATGADYAGQYAGIAASLTGLYQHGAFRLTPTGTVSVTRDWQDGYVETSGAVSPAQQHDVGVLSANLEAGYLIELAHDRSLEPFAGAGVQWTFMETGTPAAVDPISAVDVELSAGLNAALSQSAALSLSGSVSGLTTTNYIVGAVNAQLSAQF